MSDRPRTRFDAIAEEMEETPRMTVPEEAAVVLDGETFACPKCNLNAFELSGYSAFGVGVVCLGCPTNPMYTVNRDAEVKTNRYRCGKCGNEPLVTLTLSEVNLYCRRCAQLTLHTRELGVVTPKVSPSQRRARLTEAARVRLDAVVAGVITANEASAPVGRDPRWRAMNTDAMVEAMRRTLGLEDFEEFRAKVRKKNYDLAVLSGGDLDLKRGSGRTTRGILQTLAACIIQETDVLWVCGHRPSYDDDLRRLCREIAVRLRLEHPDQFREMPDDLRVIKYGQSPGGQRVYVDHTFYESGNERRLDAGMLKGIVEAQERS